MVDRFGFSFYFCRFSGVMQPGPPVLTTLCCLVTVFLNGHHLRSALCPALPDLRERSTTTTSTAPADEPELSAAPEPQPSTAGQSSFWILPLWWWSSAGGHATVGRGLLLGWPRARLPRLSSSLSAAGSLRAAPASS